MTVETRRRRRDHERGVEGRYWTGLDTADDQIGRKRLEAVMILWERDRRIGDSGTPERHARRSKAFEACKVCRAFGVKRDDGCQASMDVRSSSSVPRAHVAH